MPGAPHSDKTFFGLHLYLEEKYCKNPKVPRAQLNVNPTRVITWFVGVTICCTFFNNNSLSPRQFLCNKILFLKISYSKGNAHLTNFWIERACAPWRIRTPITGCFHDKTISKENIWLDCYVLLKNCRMQCNLLPPTGPNHLQNLTPKCRILDVFWT